MSDNIPACLMRFTRHQGGSITILVAVFAFLLILCVGAAVDMTRAQILQQRMSSALDAAGLAAGATAIPTPTGYATVQDWVQAQATKYFNANFPANYLASSAITPVATYDAGTGQVFLTANGIQATSFMSMAGINTVSVGTNSTISRPGKSLEIVLVLDVTGSMNQSLDASPSSLTKLQALINAANLFTTTVYGGATTLPHLWIGVVPFSQAVNIGTGYTSWMDPADPTPSSAYGTEGWKGCVLSRATDFPDRWPHINFNIDPYSPPVASPFPWAAYFRKYYYASDPSGGMPPMDAASPNDTGYNIWNMVSGTPAPSSTSLSYPAGGPNWNCPPPITPMTASKANVNAAIAALTAQGDTDLDIGIAWGERLLSPCWQTGISSDPTCNTYDSYFSGWGGEMATNNLPLNWNTPHSQKVVVLMTDGWNHFTPGNYTAYGYLSDGALGATDEATAESQMDNNFGFVCGDLKSHNVVVYTVGFGTKDGGVKDGGGLGSVTSSTPNSVNGTLLSSCASTPANYYLAQSNAQLTAVFASIGNSLSNLYISQ